jgi:hypothetical protein
MDVVELQHQRLPRRQPLDELAHRVMRTEALDRRARCIGARPQRAQRGEHRCQLAQAVGREALVRARVERFEIGVEGVDHEPEGELALELARPAPQHQAAAPLGRRPSSASSDVLPIPGSPAMTANRDAPAHACSRTSPSQLQLDVAPDERFRKMRHASVPGRAYASTSAAINAS